MASHNFSFIVVTPEEFENRMKADECARAATTASLPVTGAACKPPRKLSAPVVVVPKLRVKKKSSSPPFRSSKVIPINSYMGVVGAIPLAPDLVVIISSASSLML
jgi:hypothetical protein